MKRHVQEFGVKPWAGQDLLDLQAEPMKAIDAFFEEYGNCIIRGLEISPSGVDNVYNITSGLVALSGKDPEGNDVFCVAPFAGAEAVTLPLYLTLTHTVITRPYADKKVRPVAYDYCATASAVAPADNVPYLELTADGGRRFIDAINLSCKLDKNGNGKDVTVSFPEAAGRTNIASGEKLSALCGKVKRWFADLKAVAFTGRAADLETDAAHRLVTDAEKTAWGGKAAAVHPHTVADVNGLQNELNGKYSMNYSYTGDADAILGSLAGKFYGAQNAPYQYYPFLSFGHNLYRGQFNTINNSLKFRSSKEADGALGPWVEIWHSGNFNPANHTHTADQVNDSKMQTVISGNIIRKILVAAVKSDCGYMSRAGIGLANPKNDFSPLLLSVGQNDDGTRFTDFYFHPDGSITSPLGRFATTSQLSPKADKATTMEVICAGEVLGSGGRKFFKGVEFVCSSLGGGNEFEVKHNYGDMNYIVQVTGINREVAAIYSKTSSSFIVGMKPASSIVPSDSIFSFIMYKM